MVLIEPSIQIYDKKIIVPWEDGTIQIDLDFGIPREAIIYKSMREMHLQISQLQGTVQELQKNTDKYIVYKFLAISIEEAKTMIVTYLKSIKQQRSHISIFEISQHLQLPADQVEDILEKLDNEGRVSLENG